MPVFIFVSILLFVDGKNGCGALIRSQSEIVFNAQFGQLAVKRRRIILLLLILNQGVLNRALLGHGEQIGGLLLLSLEKGGH